jgi:AraC-like DNA-binding protein
MRKIILGKYFQKILLYFTVLIIVGVLGIVFTVYLRVEEAVQRMHHENTQRLFEQTAYTFDIFHLNAFNTSRYLYSFNDDVRFLMSSMDVETDIAAGIIAMNRIGRTLHAIKPGIHSIQVFNPHAGRFYSSYRGFLYEDSNLISLMESLDEPISMLRPLYRYIGDGFPVFTYLLFERPRGARQAGGIALNIDARVFLGALWPDTAEHRGETVFLLTEFDTIIKHGFANIYLATDVLDVVPDLYARGMENVNGVLSVNLRYDRNIVSYSYLRNFGMLLVSVQPYAAIERQITTMRNIIVFITAVFLATMLAATVMISWIIYHPVNKLVQDTSYVEKAPVDEISYLSDLYIRHREMFDKYEAELQSNKRELKDFWFKKLLTGDVHETEATTTNRLKEYGITKANGFIVCVLRLGRLYEIEKSVMYKEIRLLKFTILNVAQEVFAESFENYGVDFKEDHVVVVLADSEGKDLFYEASVLCKNVMDFVARHFEIYITASLSAVTDNAKQIATAYKDAAANSDYRFVLGLDSVITPEKVAANIESNVLNLSFKSEDAVTEAIRNGSADKIAEAVEETLISITGYKFSNIVISIIHLTNTIMETISGTRKTVRRVETEQNLAELLRGITAIETITEYKTRLMMCLAPYLDEGRGGNTKHVMLTEQIKDFITSNLGDANLCLKQIADMSRMSSKHVNHIFKSCTGASIPEYVTDMRMKKAVHMLETTSLSIKEIAVRVGVENQTYFYSKFKKHFGVSPKTYQLDYLIKQNNPNNR